MVRLEDKLKDYIKDKSQETGVLSLPLTQIADEIDSSSATVWRALQKLEDKKIIRIVRSQHKIQPNDIYYVGEVDATTELIEDLMLRAAILTVMLKELKEMIETKDTEIFELKKRNKLLEKKAL